MRQYAKDNKLTCIHEIKDDGYSGTDLNRPGLDQLRDLAAEGLIEGVLILSPDRLSRKQAHQIILMEEFKKYNIQVIFSNLPIGDSAEDQLMLQIQGAVSEYERVKILDRTRRGRLHAAKNGQILGANTPYGYKFVKKSGSNPAHYERDPAETEIVQMIFNWYVNKGLKGPSITKRLEGEGIPSRSGFDKWWTSTIYAILKNETYLGVTYTNKTKVAEPRKNPKVNQYRKRKKSSKVERPRSEWIPIPVTQIIEQNTWQAAQKLLAENAVKSPRNNKKNKYLLRGLVICGVCGSIASGYVSNRNTYYSCGAKRNKNLTTKPHNERIAVQHTELDDKVWAGLTNLLDDPENLRKQLKVKLGRSMPDDRVDQTAISKVEKELEKLTIQESRIIDAYRESIIDLDELREQKAKISKRVKVLEANRKAATSQVEGSGKLEITDAMLDDISAHYHRVMAKADFVTRTKIANLLVNRIHLAPR